MRKNILKLFVTIIAVTVAMSFSGLAAFAGAAKARAEAGQIDDYVLPTAETDTDNSTTLVNGVYEIAAENFIFEGGTKVVTENKDSYLVFALSGKGYEYIIKDNVNSAAEKGDHPENWTKFTLNQKGEYEFKIPFDKKETKIPLVAVSKKYYDKFKAGEVNFSRCLFARQVEVNLEKKTIVSDNYHNIFDLKIDNKVKELSVKGASMDEVGSPFANDFSRNLTITVNDDSVDKLFLGSAADAEKAEDKDVIKLAENAFALNNLKNASDKFPVAFHNKKDGKWYDKFMHIAGKTLKIQKSNEETIQDLEKEVADKEKEIKALKNELAAEKAKHMTVSNLKIKAGKNLKFTLTWKKNKDASGYVVQIKKPGSKKYVALKTLSASKYVTGKYKKNKKYGFRICTYKKIDGKKVYGIWKTYKTIKCK